MAENVIEPIELVAGVFSEEMVSMYMDTSLIEPKERLYQLNGSGHRYYYRYDEDGTPHFYPSVTTILSQTMPQNPFLVKWIADMGYEEAERYKLERASYGTFMHAQFERLIIEKGYDLDKLRDRLKDYIEVNRLPQDFINYADDLKKDVLAFAQFIFDYDVRPIAVEIALYHPEKNYAGMIDLPCRMRKKIGSDEYINAIVDFKSGRKGFYEEHELQLHLYKDMWEANYPDIKIDKLYNFSPKDWRKSPTYNLKDQTNSANALKVESLLTIAGIEDAKRDNTFLATSGVIELGAGADALKGNFITMSLSDLVTSNRTSSAS